MVIEFQWGMKRNRSGPSHDNLYTPATIWQGFRPLVFMPGEDRMDNHFDKHSLDQKHPSGFSAGLQIVRTFFRRLIGLFTVTEQDLRRAGIYHR